VNGRAARFLGVRAEDIPLLTWLVALFAVTQAGHGLGSNTGDALFFVRFGVEFLPRMLVLSGVAVMIVTIAYAAGMSRVGLGRLLPWAAWGLAALLVVERLLAATDVALIYAVIWLTEQAVVLVTFTMMWGAAAEACDTRQAKRVFPVLASAGIGGGFVGNLLTGPLAVTLGTPNVLLIHAALLVVVGVLLTRIARRFFTASPGPAPGALVQLRAGLRATRTSRLFRLTSLAAFGFSLLFFLVVVPFAEVVTASFASDAQVAAFLGYFSAAATAGSLGVSLLVTNRLLGSLGVVVTVLALPIMYVLGFSLWAVSFSLTTAAIVRGGQWIAVNAIAGTAFQSLFNVVRPPIRGQVTAFVAAVPTQLGVVAGGAALTLGVAALPIRWLALTGAVVAVATAVVVWRMRSAYVGDLLHALRGGLGDVFTAASRSPRTPVVGADLPRAIGQALADERPERRRTAIAVLGLFNGDLPVDLLIRAANDADSGVRAVAVDRLTGVDDPRATAATMAALDDTNGAVRRAAVRAVGQRDPSAVAITAALRDPDPAVRAEGAALVRGVQGQAVLTGMLRSASERDLVAALDAAAVWVDAPVRSELEDLTADQRATVRLGAATALAARTDAGALDTVIGLLDDPRQTVRDGVAALLRGRDDCVEALVATLRNGPPRAQLAAAAALGDQPAAHDAVVHWATGQTERAEILRHYRTELLSGTPAALPSRDYLARVVAQREWRAVRGVLLAVESLAGRDAAHLLTRAARAGDLQLHAHAVEAIDSLADRPLARRIVPLLEDEPETTPASGDATTWSLLTDSDEWLRALAVRAAADQIRALRSLLRDRVEGDDSPLVADALRAAQEVPMPPPDPSTGLIDRILALQQVPMFSDLAPEDLRQVAQRCAERSYAPDEVIYRQGDLGDEMFIVTVGQVRISRTVAGHTEVLRRYGPGDHVGELSLLRGRPRVADVIADDAGAGGLSLDAASFRAILDDRPEVAMAMLATLAERLGTA
jgi:hypothetical protein